MARQRAVETHIELSKGFATEINPVVATPEVLVDINNCIIARDGTIRRRMAVEFESAFATNLINGSALGAGDLDTVAFSTSLWTAVSNIGTLNIVVQQVGTVVQFFSQFGALSSNFLGELDLATFAVDPIEIKLTSMQMTSGLGKLFVVNPFMDSVVITFEEGVFSAEAITLKQRDFDGLEDDLEVDERPTTLTRNHYYNLVNQGWTDANIATFGGVSTGTDFCTATAGAGLSAAGGKDFPSNADIMHVGIVVNSGGDLEFDPDFIREDFLGNTPAPRGHFILEAFNKDYNAALVCTGFESAVTNNRPEAIAFHAGRVFYASPIDNDVGSGIYYSQNLLSDDRVGLCFQEADPTATEINDLVATDGGYLPTPGVGQVYKMQEMSNGVVVFASNGVWYLTGAEIGSGVTATSLRMDKIYSSGVLGASSIVEAEGDVYFFGEEGIMQVQVTIEGASVENISKSSIQTFYTSISSAARTKAVSEFIPTERKIFWGYSSPAVSGSNIDKFLILDLDVGGYYKYDIVYDEAQTYPHVVGMSRVAPLAQSTVSSSVLDTAGNVVTESDGTTLVTTNNIVDSSQLAELKLATLVEDTGAGGFLSTFSSFDGAGFRDWAGATVTKLGLPMVSSIDFAQTAMGAVHTKGRPTHVHTYYSKETGNTPQDTLILPIGCSTSLDLVLLLDVSNSLVSSGFLVSDIKPAIKTFITDILGNGNVRIAIDGFSSDVKHFEDFTDVEATLHAAVDTAYADPISGSFTALSAGIDLGASTVMAATGVRAKAMVIITDGVGNLPFANPQQAAFDSAEATRDDFEIYVVGIGGRDGFADAYLETWISHTIEHYSQVDNYNNIVIELAKLSTCPDTVPVPFDYVNVAPATNWVFAKGSLDVSDLRVEWIEDLGLYILASEAGSYVDNVVSNIHTSPDGITWTPRDAALRTSITYDIAWSPTLNLAVTIGYQDGGDGTPAIRTSPDGINWTARVVPNDGFYYSVVWDSVNNIFVGVGDPGIMTSADGITWTHRLVTAAFSSVAFSSTQGLVALRRNSTDDAYISADGITWVQHASVLPAGVWFDIDWSPAVGKFVAVSTQSSAHAAVAYSTDGTAWTAATIPGGTSKNFDAVRWFPAESKFFAISTDGTSNIISSTDGITWIEETALTEWTGLSPTKLVDIARKSSTEWVTIYSGGVLMNRSTAAPF